MFKLRDFWQRIWKLVSFQKKQIKILVGFIVVEQLVRLVGPYILKIIIDTITNFSPEKLKTLAFLVGVMFITNQTISLIGYFGNKRGLSVIAYLEEHLFSRAHEQLVFLDLEYHEKENTGSKISKIQRGIHKIEELVGNFFWDVFPTIIQVFFTAIVLFWVDYRFGLVITVFIPVFVWLTFRVNRIVYPLRKKRFSNQDDASGVMAQSVININTVKSFVQEKKEIGLLQKIARSTRKIVLNEYGILFGYDLRRNLVIDAGRISILFFGVYLVMQGSFTVGSLVFVYTISEKALVSLYRITRLYDRIMEAGEATRALADLLKEKSHICNPKNGIRPKNLEGRIEFSGVSFIYPGSKDKALDNVTFAMNSGCMTAVVGPSGGGKTTLTRLIYRHYDPQKGDVLLDGNNIKSYDLYAMRERMAIVPQEVEIFNSTVKENIAYAAAGATIAEVEAAAKIANAHEFIVDLKGGYNTIVGERGIKLSGGQRQRIGIARAILANPKVLIFDEATSNLDSSSERLIQEAMDKVAKNRTVIVIAHRLSTVQRADKIIVLEKGKVVEEGSHTELSKMSGGLYQKLLELQKLGDVE